MMPLLRLLRPWQWPKNLLVFASLLAGHQYGDLLLVYQTALVFVAFCALASAGYIVNDLLDVEDDRHHPDKCRRPIAAGEVPTPVAVILALVLAVAGLLATASINDWVALTGLGYLAVTLAYSLWIKRRLFMDIVVLAGLYCLRIVAGVAVMGTEPSFWLLAFAMFIFASLAALKRCVELGERPADSLASHSVRAYRPAEIPTLTAAGLAGGFLSVLVLAFYLDSPQVRALYTHTGPLWLLCPLLMYWVGRLWLLAGRSLVHPDPILFALRDRASYLVAVVTVVLVWLAR